MQDLEEKLLRKNTDVRPIKPANLQDIDDFSECDCTVQAPHGLLEDLSQDRLMEAASLRVRLFGRYLGPRGGGIPKPRELLHHPDF